MGMKRELQQHFQQELVGAQVQVVLVVPLVEEGEEGEVRLL